MRYEVVWRGEPISRMSTAAKSIYPVEVWNNYIELVVYIADAKTHRIVAEKCLTAPTDKGWTEEEVLTAMKNEIEKFEQVMSAMEFFDLRLAKPRDQKLIGPGSTTKEGE